MYDESQFPIVIPFIGAYEDGTIEVSPDEGGVMLEIIFGGGGAATLVLNIDLDQIATFAMALKAVEQEMNNPEGQRS